VTSTASTKEGLNGVAQWSLSRGRLLMYEGSIVVLLGTRPTSTVDLARIMRIYAWSWVERTMVVVASGGCACGRECVGLDM
jgi:hypothetical protein